MALMERQPFDVVVTDIILPRVSGTALLQSVRERSPDVQVVAMTDEPTGEYGGPGRAGRAGPGRGRQGITEESQSHRAGIHPRRLPRRSLDFALAPSDACPVFGDR
jgi:hypothetical protein